MRIEERKGRIYVYEVRRIGGRVVRTYVGSGEGLIALAKLEALELQAARQERQRESDELLEHIEEAEQVDARLEALEELTARAIEAHGLHRPKRGQLRRKRHGEED